MENLENQWSRYADGLLGVLPPGREEEILAGSPEGFRPCLAGTPMEALLAPQNERFFGSVIGVARSRIEEKKKGG